MKQLFSRLLFLAAVYAAGWLNHLRGRRTAFNAVLTPSESSRGTQSMIPDNGVLIQFRNAVVKVGSDDHHFTTVAAYTDIPRGILLNDQVDAGETDNAQNNAPQYVKKDVAIFGLYPGTLPAQASGAIAVDAEVVCDPANPGQVMQLPAAAGTYVTVGRSRFTVVSPGDPVSIIHHCPRVLTH